MKGHVSNKEITKFGVGKSSGLFGKINQLEEILDKQSIRQKQRFIKSLYAPF